MSNTPQNEPSILDYLKARLSGRKDITLDGWARPGDSVLQPPSLQSDLPEAQPVNPVQTLTIGAPAGHPEAVPSSIETPAGALPEAGQPFPLGKWLARLWNGVFGGLGDLWTLVRSEPLRWQLLLVSLAASLYVLAALPRRESTESHLLITLAWMVSIGVFMPVVWTLPAPKKQTVVLSSRLWLVLGGVVVLAAGLRFWELVNIPYNLGGDEASQGLEIVKVLTGEYKNPFTTGWLSVPTMAAFVNAIWLEVFGQTIFGLRFPWALYGTLTVPLTFFVVKRVHGPRLGLVVAALVALYHFHIHYSRLGSHQVGDPFFMVLMFLFLYRAVELDSPRDWALTGVVAGFVMYFYAGGRATPLLLLAIILYFALYGTPLLRSRLRTGPWLALAAFLITAAPMLQYAQRFPDMFNARVNQVGIFQSGWLDREVDIIQKTKAEILVDQFKRSVLAFNYYSDRTIWYGLREPLLDPYFGAVFLFSLIFTTLRVMIPPGDWRIAPFVGWWWAGTLLGGMLTITPPSTMRIVTLTVPTMFIVGYGLWTLVKYLKKFQPRLPQNVLLLVLVGVFGFLSIQTYFVEFSPQRIYGSRRAEAARELAEYLTPMPGKPFVYFVGAPFMYWDFATLPYLAPEVDAFDIHEAFTNAEDARLYPLQGDTLFVVLPEREGELPYITSGYPGGVSSVINSPVDGRPLLFLYQVTP